MARLDSEASLRASSGSASNFTSSIDGSDNRNHKEQVLRFSVKLKTAAVSTVAAVALMAVGVSSASAAVALWNSPGQAKVTGSLTISGGGPPTVCTFNANYIYNASNALVPTAAQLRGGFGGSDLQIQYCSNGNWLSFGYANTSGVKTGSVYSLSSNATGNGLWEPFGSPGYNNFYTRTPYSVPFINGTVSTPSTIVYNNTLFGDTYGTPLRATGTLTITKTDGSLLKLV